MNDNKIVPQPFIKWVGGKRQLINKILEKTPKNFNNYYEPFLGGGAVFFNIDFKNKAYINDINKQLINSYVQIRDSKEKLIKLLDKLNENDITLERYLILRDDYNKKIINKELDLETASLFIMLNKYCFNGVYRVNKKGLYNVPWNKKMSVNVYDNKNIELISKKLKNVEITSLDFEKVLNTAKKGDFIFFDSPYAPLNENSFDSYTKSGFLKEDHVRLSEQFKRLDKLGCYVMLTNHNTKFICELYKDFNIEEVSVKRMVNSDATNRIGKEIIVTNY